MDQRTSKNLPPQELIILEAMAARQVLRESAVVKLMTGQALTEEEAHTMVGG